MRKFVFVFSSLLCAALVDWIGAVNCPNGFVVYNNACVQAARDCPANFIWQNGVCVGTVETQPVTTATIVPTGCAQNTALQTVPCTSNAVNCANTATPCCSCSCPNSAPCNNCPQTTPCATNQPCVTPCQNTQPCTPPCQNSQPCVTPCQNSQPCTTPCQNTQPCTTPCQNTQPCAPTCQNSQPCTPCGNCVQAAPCATSPPCPNNPPVMPCTAVQPCANNPQITPCAVNQPCTVNPPITPCAVNIPCTYIPPVTPCTVNPLPPVTQPPVTQPPVTQPPTEAPTPPPGTIKKCPPGTVEIDNVCRLIGCGKWYIYMHGNCVRVECPMGTIWTGEECVEPEPTVYEFTFKNTINTQINHTEPAIVIDNVHNLNVPVVAVGGQTDCSEADYGCAESEVPSDDYDIPVPEPQPEPDQTKCCTVMTPRICKPNINGDQKHWRCYSRRHKRCGSICISSTVYLIPPEPVKRPGLIVMPPRETQFMPPTNDYSASNSYDCSGCVFGQPESCAPYCQRSVCPPRSCRYYDQRRYCAQYPGEIGCREEDGCYSDWCSSSQPFY